MANCHSIFIKFNESITLTSSRKSSLRSSRNSLRSTIRKYIKDEKPDETQPMFHGQGSFAMNTAVNPIPDDEKLKYDLDDGIYFMDDIEKRKDVATYHNWIRDAVGEHTKESVIDKNSCVRVTFSDGHHIDLPIYFKNKEGNVIPELAHKSKGWTQSDPKVFVKWFRENKNDQIIRLVKYSKAWLDKKSSSSKMLSGFAMTILIVNNYNKDERDDIALLETMKAIKATLSLSFVCYRPTPDRNENLFDKYSQQQKDNFINKLSKLIDDGDKAIENPNQRTASEKWQKHFGSRYPSHLANDELEEENVYDAPAIIKASAKSS
jgi:hypothetical protein